LTSVFVAVAKESTKDVEKYREQASIDTTDIISPAEAPQSSNLDFIDNTAEKDVSSR
jgi:hypothetical protein